MLRQTQRPLSRWYRMICAAALAAFAISGCGGSDKADSGTGSAGKGEIVITCAMCQRSTVDPFIQYNHEATKRFNEKYKGRYRVEIVNNPHISGSTERPAYYKRLALADDLPDVLLADGPERKALEKTGKLFSYSDALDEDPAWRDSFHDGVLDNVSGEDGQVLAIPQQRDVLGIYYNKRLFREAGVAAFPTTWDELEATCDKIKGIGKSCLAFDGDWTTLLMWAHLIGTQEGGAEVLENDLASGDYASNSLLVTATEMLKAWHVAGYVNKDSLAAKYENASGAYVSGDAAMVANGPWMVPYDIKNKDAPKELYGETGYAPAPGFDAGQGIIVLSGGSGYASGAKDEDKQAAVVEFMKFLTSRDEQVAFTLKTGSYPPTKVEFSAAETKQLEPLAIELAKEAEQVPNQYKEAHFVAPSGFADAWKNLWPAYVRGDLSTEEFLSRLGSDATSVTG